MEKFCGCLKIPQKFFSVKLLWYTVIKSSICICNWFNLSSASPDHQLLLLSVIVNLSPRFIAEAHGLHINTFIQKSISPTVTYSKTCSHIQWVNRTADKSADTIVNNLSTQLQAVTTQLHMWPKACRVYQKLLCCSLL